MPGDEKNTKVEKRAKHWRTRARTCDDVPVWSFKVQKWNITNTIFLIYMPGGEKQTWHWTRQGFNWGMILKSWKLENKSSYPPHFQWRSVQKSEGGPVAECGPPIYNYIMAVTVPPLPKKEKNRRSISFLVSEIWIFEKRPEPWDTLYIVIRLGMDFRT